MSVKHCVWLPGFCFNHGVFKTYIERINCFDKNIKMTCVDLSLCNTLDDMIHELKHHIVTASYIIGWSMGGLPAIQFAYLHPTLCKQLILIASTAKFRAEESWPGIQASHLNRFEHKLSSDAFKQFFKSLVAFPAMSNELDQAFNQHIHVHQRAQSHFNILKHTDLSAPYQALTTPVTLITGGKDAIIPHETSHAMLALNNNTNLIKIQDAGHAIPFTHHDQLYDAILSVIKN